MCTPLVRHGADQKLEKDRKTGKPNHIFQNVYTEMYLQVTRDYSSLPDPRTLKSHEIKFFYEGLRSELKEHTKPKSR